MLLLDREIQQLCLSLGMQEEPDEQTIQTLLAQMQQAIQADAVFLLTAHSGTRQFIASYRSATKMPYADTDSPLSFSDEEYEHLLLLYRFDNPCNDSLQVDNNWSGSLLHYGCVCGNVFCGAVVFWRQESREWTRAEQNSIKQLGLSLRLLFMRRYLETLDAPLDFDLSDSVSFDNTDANAYKAYNDDSYWQEDTADSAVWGNTPSQDAFSNLFDLVMDQDQSERDKESEQEATESLPLDNRALSNYRKSLETICDSVLLISVWEDHYQAICMSEEFQRLFAPQNSYSAMVAQYVDHFVSADFQADTYYRLSSEYIYTTLTPDNPYLQVDYQNVSGSLPTYYRIHIVLLDTNSDGYASHVIFAIQDITTQVKKEDLSNIAFSLMLNSYCRIAFIDLTNGNLIPVHVMPEESLTPFSIYRYKETVSQSIVQYILPEYQEKITSLLLPNYLHSIFDHGVPSLTFSYQRYIKGKNTWVRSEIVPLTDYTPTNAHLMWYTKNISEDEAKKDAYIDSLLQANLELSTALSSEKSYRLALMADSHFYFTFDVSGDGFIKEENLSQNGLPIIQAITGMDLPIPFETFCQKWYEAYHPVFDKKVEENVLTLDYLRDAFLRNERIIDIEVKQTPPKDNHIMEFMEMYIVLSEDEMSGHIMACIIWKDISEVRSRELQTRIALKDAYEIANQANKAKSEFLSRMSHDIRTPMNAIIGMTAIAQTYLNDPERVADCLQKINVSSKHLLSLINEVLDMSKIESGKVDLNEEEFNLSDLIDNLSLMVRPRMAEKHHQFNIQLNNVEHEKLIGDSLRLQQSFINLMSNAVKYTPEGGRIDLIITEKPCHHSFACFEFIFQDNGIGMSPEFVRRIFEPFSRAEDTRINKIQGTGLGMAITNNLVHMMNGDIKVESTLGKGSRFIVTIYLRLQETEIACYSDFNGLSVLITDDDQATCETACNILKEMGINGEWVLTGTEAVEKVIAQHKTGQDYFAVILDWKMPGMDGIQVTQEIRRQIGNKMPIVIVSAYDWSDIELDARSAGANAFISKPLFKSRFVFLFREILNEGREEENVGADSLELTKQDFQGKRILLVEDNDLNTEIATEILNMAGLEVEHAENGKRAVEMFQESDINYYNLIFMDIQMPVMNGYESAKAIRALAREDAATVPIVAMTANAFVEDIEHAIQSGMNEHIAKPLDFDHLNVVLTRWL